MDMIRFEWDENKNLINQRKHGVSFDEAKSVFYDEEALVIDDPEHSWLWKADANDHIFHMEGEE